MSHVCLMANKTGIVVAGDRFLTYLYDPHSLHPSVAGDELVDKCIKVPERGIVCAFCGILFIDGLHVGNELRRLLAQEETVDAVLDELDRKIVPRTRTNLASGHPVVSYVLIGPRKNKTTTIWSWSSYQGTSNRKVYPISGEMALSLQAGMYASELPLPASWEISHLTFDQLRQRARDQIAQAIDEDARRDRADLNYLPTVGGEILSYGIKLNQNPPAGPAGRRR